VIKYLFTGNNLIGSRAISSMTKFDFQKKEETPSHFAILFDDRWVFHSNFANGVHVEPYKHFIKKNNIIVALYDIQCCNYEKECVDFQDHLIHFSYGSGYDWFAIIYFCWRLLLNKMFNIKIPEKNRLESSSRWFCNELFELKLGIDLSMKTPNDIMFMLHHHPDFETCEINCHE